MSDSRGESVSRVRYSVRNCWSTLSPNRYSLVAPSGIPRVTVTRPATPIVDVSSCPHADRPYRYSNAAATRNAIDTTCPSVVSDRATFDEL